MNRTKVTAYMEKALQLANEGMNNGELPIGAIIVHKNNIVARAYTQDIQQRRRLVHAEFLVLEQVDKLKPSTDARREMILFTTLEPCFFCLGAAVAFGIGKIFFALESPIDGAVKLLDSYFDKEEFSLGYNVPKVQGGVLRRKSLELFREFESDNTTSISEWVKLLVNSVNE